MGSTEVNSWISLVSIVIAVTGWIAAGINWLRKSSAQKGFNKLRVRGTGTLIQ